MKRDYLGEESQARYNQDSLDTIRGLGNLAREEKAQFVVVSGDIFESNFIERKTILRALDAMAQIKVPVFLLPGNHDPLDYSSIYKSKVFVDNKPSNVTVISSHEIITISPGVQIVGAPWMSKRPLSDILCDACRPLDKMTGGVRILVGHGAASSLSMNRDDPATIDVPTLERMINDGVIQYVALGDRHSVTCIGGTSRIWYSGSHLATDFGEERSGYALVVDLERDCVVEERRLSQWQFIKKDFLVNDDADLETIDKYLSSLPNKDKAVLRLGLKGAISVRGRAELDELLVDHRDLCASIEEWDKDCDLIISPGEGDIEALSLRGFADEAMKKLLERSKVEGDEGRKARDAIVLLHRLARGCS